MQFRDFDCPVCGGKQTLKERFWFNSHGDGMVYWECEKCGARSKSFDSYLVFLKFAEMLKSVSVWPNKNKGEE